MNENSYIEGRVEINRLSTEFYAKSCNESLARAIVSACAVQLDPTLSELSDIVTAVSEAVTNSIIHGYANVTASRDKCTVRMECVLYGDAMEVTVTDRGCGIENIEKAREPMFTSSPEMERSGMGFTIMESFTDHFSVWSEPGKGTEIKLFKIFNSLSGAKSGGESKCENMTTEP